MKRLNKILFAASLAYSITAITSFAQVVTFDENGHGNFNGATLPFSVGPDPSGGLPVNVLIYTLPFVVTPGDVGLIENPGTTVTLSDDVRFYNPSGANFSDIIFYSDFEAAEPDHDIADTGLPRSPNAILIPEIGPEDSNGAVWTPVPGQPGSTPTGAQIAYNIISDVPEPGTLTLAALGGGLLLTMLKRRHQA